MSGPILIYKLLDVIAPLQVTSLDATNGDTQSVLTWSAASDNVAVTAYRVYKDGMLLVTLGNVLTYTATSLTNGTTYSFTVSAGDAAGNWGAQSSAKTATPESAAPAYLFFDDFNRADGTLSSPWSDAWYNASKVEAVVSSNVCDVYSQPTSATYSAKKAAGFTACADMSVSVTLSEDMAQYEWLYLLARLGDTTGYAVRCTVLTGVGQVRLYKMTSEAQFTSLAAAATEISLVVGTVIKILTVGSTITVMVDGVQKLQLTNADYSSAGYAGFYAYSSSGAQHIKFDDFLVEAAS